MGRSFLGVELKVCCSHLFLGLSCSPEQICVWEPLLSVLSAAAVERDSPSSILCPYEFNVIIRLEHQVWENRMPLRHSDLELLSCSDRESNIFYCAVLGLVTQSCPTLCNSMNCSPSGSSVHGASAGKNTGVGCHALLWGIFPTQGSNLGLLHCRLILYHLSLQGRPHFIVDP